MGMGKQHFHIPTHRWLFHHNSFLVEKSCRILYNNSTMIHFNPKPDVSLAALEHLFWDYHYTFNGQELYDFVLGQTEIPTLNRDEVKARILMTVGWYRLIDIFGLKNLHLLLTDEALQWVWVEDLRSQYALARRTIELALS